MQRSLALSLITLIVGTTFTQCGGENKENFSSHCDGGTPDAGQSFTIEIESPPVTADVRGVVRARVQATHPAGIKFILFCLAMPTSREDIPLEAQICQTTLGVDFTAPYEADWDTNEMILINGQPERRDLDGLYYFGFYFVAGNGESQLYWHALTVKNDEASP